MSRPRWVPAAGAAILLLSLFFVYDHAREDSLSADEPVHILAGYLQVFGSNAIVNIEHPPLMKILAGAALGPLSLPPPPEKVPLGTRFTDYGHAFLFGSRVSPDAIIAAARAPFLIVLAALLLLVFLAARARFGPLPALFAASLLAFDPNLVAHAGVVHTDLGAAFFFTASVLAWERARREPSPARLGLAALTLGLALTTKFSTVYLAPILLLQTLLAEKRDREAARRTGAALMRLALVGAGALIVVFAVYWSVTRRLDPAEQRQVIHEMVGLRGAPELSQKIQGLATWSPALAHYIGGLASVARQNAVGGGVNYLMGRVSTTGFPEYFFVAFLAKSTPAFLIVTLLAAWSAWDGSRFARIFRSPRVPPREDLSIPASSASRGSVDPREARRGTFRSPGPPGLVGGRFGPPGPLGSSGKLSVPRTPWPAREDARLYLLPVGVLFLASINASYNIGIRHMLPVYPLLALAAAGALARLRERGAGRFPLCGDLSISPKLGRGTFRSPGRPGAAAAVALGILLPALSLVELVRIHPHELSYFNPAAGGPEGGRRILSDSNLDWGLDLRRLAAELARRGIEDPTVVYFGGDDVLYRIGVNDFSAEPRVRGRLVAFSAFHLAVGPEYYAYQGAHTLARRLAALRAEANRQKPVGRVGYSLYLFDLEPGTSGRGEATR